MPYLEKDGLRVIVFSQPPLLKRNPIRCMGVSELSYSFCANASYENIIRRGLFINETILNENILNNKTNFYLILDNFLCDHNKKYCFSKKESKLLYKDDDHLSYEGVYFVSKEWEKKSYFPFK